MDRTSFFFIIIWIQPIFWMVLFNFKTDKLDRLFKPLVICLVATVVIIEANPSLRANVYATLSSFKLMYLYSILGCVFTWYLMDVKKWHLPQALSISALAAFIGSFYWEAPYIIRNAILVGFEWDWLLHIMVIFLVWYIRNSVGWCRDRRKLILLTCGGFVVSIILMILNPVPVYSDKSTTVVVWDAAHYAAVWNSAYYLMNRVICTTIIFILINKDDIEGIP